MDYLAVLFSYLVIGTIISLIVSLFNLLVKPYFNIEKYSLTTGLILSVLVFTAYNMGIMTTLQIPIEGVTNQPYFQYVDIGFTSMLGIGGAKGFRMLVKKLGEAKTK